MLLRVGNYLFDANACAVSSRVRLVTAPGTGRPLRYVAQHSVEGWLEGDDQADLAAAEAALRAALLKPYQDLRFLTDAGADTPLSLRNADSITGVRVLGFAFPGGDGAEYATLRRFTAEVEAEFLLPDARNAVTSFSESLSRTGNGGPATRLRVPINPGAPITRQILTPRSVIRYTQSGQATGHTAYVPAPAPRWPAYLLHDRVRLEQSSPQQLGRGYVEYPSRWSYEFEADAPLTGVPALPPL